MNRKTSTSTMTTAATKSLLGDLAAALDASRILRQSFLDNPCWLLVGHQEHESEYEYDTPGYE